MLNGNFLDFFLAISFVGAAFLLLFFRKYFSNRVDKLLHRWVQIGLFGPLVLIIGVLIFALLYFFKII